MELLFDKIKNPVIETERLIINDVTPDDKKEYYALYTDDKLNKYWGYDYHEDLPENKEPSPDYFYDFMTSLKNKKEEYSLAIRLKNENSIKNNSDYPYNKMIGEGVFHNFNKNEEVEIGIRLFKKYQGFGFATEAVKAMIEYIKKFKPSVIKAKCFLQNTASKNTLLRSGFNNTGSDDTYLYFEIML